MANFKIKNPPEFQQGVRMFETEDEGNAEVFNLPIEILVNNSAYLKSEVDKLVAVKTITLTASGWSASAPYTQTVSVAGMTKQDKPIIDKYIPENSTREQEKAIKKAAGFVSYVDTSDGSITVTCIGKKPTMDLQIQIKGV